MKLADILGLVGEHDVSTYPWGKALVDSLNSQVAEHLRIPYESTGKDIIAALVMRGSTHGLATLNAEFDQLSGLLVVSHDQPDPPAALPIAPVIPAQLIATQQPAIPTAVVAVPATPAVFVPANPNSVTDEPTGQQWPAKKVVIYGVVLVVLVISLALTYNVLRGESTPNQERMLEKTIDVLGDVAKSQLENKDNKKQQTPTEPQQTAPSEPLPQPGPTDPFSPPVPP